MNKPANHLNVVELYAGTGRSADAFRHWRRARLRLLVDADPLARDTYLLNHPKAPYLTGDLSRLTSSRISAEVDGRVDILLGCPPCQGFSDTGTRDSADRRNGHLSRFARFAEELRPLAVAMENVPLAARTRRFSSFVTRLEELGYSCTWGVMNAALHGSAQCRHRLIFIAIHGDVGTTPRLPAPSHGGTGTYYSYRERCRMGIDEDRIGLLREPPAARRARQNAPHREDQKALGPLPIPTIGQVLTGLPRIDTRAANALGHFRWDHSGQTRRRMANVPEGGRWSGGSDHFSHSYGRLHRGGLAPTVTTFFANSGSGRFWHPTDNRAVSVREAARLQGFPDGFALPPSWNSCRLVGNALDAALAQVTYNVIRDCLS